MKRKVMSVNNWITCKISDICCSISDTYKRTDEYVVLVNTSDILEGKILNHKPTENKNLKGQFKKTFKKNDILYSEIRPANKRFAFVDIENTDNYIASTKLMVLRCDETKILPKFLFFVLKSSYIIGQLQLLAETRSGTFPQITFSGELGPMEINLPDFETQHKIVSIIGSLEDKIQLNNKINCNLEQQAQALFKSWFVDYDPFNHSVPPDWILSTLGDVSQMGVGGDKPQSISSVRTETYPYPIYSNGLSDEGLYGYTDTAKICEESVTVSARGTIGFVCLRHIPYVPIVRLVTLIPNTDILSAKYLYLYLRQLHITGTGTTQQQLTVPDFRKTKILVPTKEMVDTFTDIVNPFFNKIWANQAENNRLSYLRDTLLPRLMSGELDVSEVEI